MGWHAIFVKTGQEEVVSLQINNILGSPTHYDYDLLVPKRIIKERHNGQTVEIVRKMFPGYILINTNEPWDVFMKTRNLKYLYKFLNQDYVVQEIRKEEISAILYMIDDRGIIGISDIYVDNDENRIFVINGPLLNYDGVVKKIDRRHHRAKISLMFEEKIHYIDISINIIDNKQDAIGKVIPFHHIKY